MFKIGDEVFHARVNWGHSSLICPDCFGTLGLQVTLGDGSEHTIACAGCASGFNPPTGRIHVYEYTPVVSRHIIAGLEIDERGTRYKIGGGGCYSIFNEEDCFGFEWMAKERAEKLVAESKQKQIDDLQRKEKDTRSWAWHVHYYRKQIRDAKKDIERAEAKLNVALVKIKSSDGAI